MGRPKKGFHREKRMCSNCGSYTTRINYSVNKYGLHSYELWQDDGNNGWWCQKCYYMIRSVNRRYNFRGRCKLAKREVRIGVCNFCRAVVGQINTQTGFIINSTDLHHEKYDKDNPLAYTIEACPRCHSKRDKEKRDESRYVLTKPVP